MKDIVLFLHLLLFLSCTSQTKVIFDTDIDSDVDDVQALAMLHAYQKADKIDLMGIIVTSADSYSYQCASAINTFYDHPDIPIGFLKNQPDLRNFSKYTRQISEEFPHPVKSMEGTKESTKLYRQLLKDSPNNSVILVTVGHLTSLQNLLKSGPDEISPLNGQELAHKKVKKWICMGGKFPEGKEANFYRPDPVSTVYCLENWTKEAVFCGWEVGQEIITGGDYLKKELSKNHPVYRSYKLYNDFAGRPAWDQVAVSLLDHKAKDFYTIDDSGTVHVKEDGSNSWKKGTIPGRRHSIVRIAAGIAPDTVARYMDDLVLKMDKN